MKSARLPFALLIASLCTLPCPSQAAAAKAEPTTAKIENPPDASHQFVFSLFPKSAQSNPNTDLTTICEMTEEGRKRPVVTSAHPAYYIAHDAGFVDAGEVESTTKPDLEHLHKTLEKALSTNGFKPVPEGQRPEYALIFHWGTHTRNPSNDTAGDILSRAMLVGGRKFAKELADVLVEQSKNYEASTYQTDDGRVVRVSEDMSRLAMQYSIAPRTSAATNTTTYEGQMSYAGGESSSTLPQTSASSMADINRLMDSMSPIERFRRESERNAFLVEQTLGSIYFVVITAIDAEAAARGKKVLLWRARMSVDARGMSLVDALPALIANSAPFLGRDMEVPATMAPKIVRGSESIQIGDSTVVEEPKNPEVYKAK